MIGDKKLDDENRHIRRCTMSKGRRKIGKGLVLALICIFALTHPAWAATFEGTDLLIPEGYDQWSKEDKISYLNKLNRDGLLSNASLETLTTKITEGGPTGPLREVVTEIFFRIGVIANQLVVLGQTSIQTITDFVTGDVTVTKSVTNTRYNNLGEAISQTGSSESKTTSKDGTVSTSRTRLTFARNAASGGFDVVEQVTDTLTVDPGKVTEDVFDESGNKIVDARQDDTVTRQRTTIERDYNGRGVLVHAEGVIENGLTRSPNDSTTFTGTLEFDICRGVNQECLRSQTTESTTQDFRRKETTTTVSTLSQENDAFGRILSGQAVADSVTRPTTPPSDAEEGDIIETRSHSTTYFVVTDTNTLAAYRTYTTSESIDTRNIDLGDGEEGGRPDGYGTSEQNVLITLEGYDAQTGQRTGEITGRVLGATGTLSSATYHVDADWDGHSLTLAEKEAAADIAYSTTKGTLDFTVIHNEILNTHSLINIVSIDRSNNVETTQTQEVWQNYDANGVGVDGSIHSVSVTTANGVIDWRDEDGDGAMTFYDSVTGRWVFDFIDGSEADKASEATSETMIKTEFIAGQFLATEIISASVSKEFQNKYDLTSPSAVSTNVTYTRQLYDIRGGITEVRERRKGETVRDVSGIAVPENFRVELANLDPADKEFLNNLTARDLLEYYVANYSVDSNGVHGDLRLDANGNIISRPNIFTFPPIGP